MSVAQTWQSEYQGYIPLKFWVTEREAVSQEDDRNLFVEPRKTFKESRKTRIVRQISRLKNNGCAPGALWKQGGGRERKTADVPSESAGQERHGGAYS